MRKTDRAELGVSACIVGLIDYFCSSSTPDTSPPYTNEFVSASLLIESRKASQRKEGALGQFDIEYAREPE